MAPVPELDAFPPDVIPKLKTYVYRLIDPRNGETFYVGKGQGNRVFAHIRDELSQDGDELSDHTQGQAEHGPRTSAQWRPKRERFSCSKKGIPAKTSRTASATETAPHQRRAPWAFGYMS